MLARLFNLTEGSLYRTPLRLVEAMRGSNKRAWDLGYHHGIREHAPVPNDSEDAELYMKGYDAGKGASADPLKDYTRDTEFHTDIEEHRKHLKLPDWANVPTYQLGENIKSGRGMQPGDFASIVYHEGEDSDAESEARTLSPALQAYGQSIVDSDPELSDLWSAAMSSREAVAARPLAPDAAPEDDMEAHQAELTYDRDRDAAGFAMALSCADFGKSLIPPEDYEHRKALFSRSMTRKLATEGNKRALTDLDMQRVGRWSDDLFDALGPAAEETLDRAVRKVVLTDEDDNWYVEDSGTMKVFDKSGFFHEFGHALDFVLHGSDPDEPGYWSSRIQNKDSSPPTPMNLGGLNEGAVTKKDRWADSYMGKVYSKSGWGEGGETITAAAEVLPVFMEGISGYDGSHHWANQLKKDPQTLLEVMGYLRSGIEGIHQSRVDAKAEHELLMKAYA